MKMFAMFPGGWKWGRGASVVGVTFGTMACKEMRMRLCGKKVLRTVGLALVMVMGFGMMTGAWAERVYFAGYKGGFYIKSEEEGGMALRLGGSFQTDYRFYGESERADNGFDIRRARLLFRGELTRWIAYGMEFEFQGAETDNLVEAWAEVVGSPTRVRMGQFKEPFSLEWQSRDNALLFAERSMVYSLSPGRDVGMMVHADHASMGLTWALGVFNGDGRDGSEGTSEEDDPELAGRVTLQPFAGMGEGLLRGLMVGASGTWASIDTQNIDLSVKSTGMFGTSRNLYTLSHNTKFGVVQDVKDRLRVGAEAAWALGPALISGEYARMAYRDMVPVGGARSDAVLSSWYAQAAWSLTGEHFAVAGGRLKPVTPERYFNPEEGTWGAMVLAARYNRFNGDETWINPSAHVSVEEADQVSLALSWFPFPMVRATLDLSRTELSDDIRVNVQPDGTVDYIDEENVVTFRVSMDF